MDVNFLPVPYGEKLYERRMKKRLFISFEALARKIFLVIAGLDP
jgi:hypothetical protein